MSIILMTYHNENINSHMVPDPVTTPKMPRYMSELEKLLWAQKLPQMRQTFGYAKTPLPDPENFLRKGGGGGVSRPTHIPERTPRSFQVQGVKLSNIPAPQPPPAPRPPFNFRVKNIRNVHRAKGKTQRDGLLVINNIGDTKKLAGSGAIPEYSRRPEFGQMPRYLVKLNERLRVKQEQVVAKQTDWLDACELLQEEDKLALLEVVEHNENIYTILAEPPPDPQKTPRYQSQLEKELKATKVPQLRRDFGYAESPLDPPDKFLKKGQGTQPPRKKPAHKCLVADALPAVPKRPPPGQGPERPKVNFKVLNMKKLHRHKGMPIKPRLVDTRDGHIKTLKGSGEVPEFCLRPTFGRVPAYLVKRNRRTQGAAARAQRTDERRESLCRKVAEEERQKLLDGLKENWASLQKAFLQLPMLTDTVPKILKKTKMEQELREMEKDIAFIESNPHIYVFDDGSM